MMFLCEILAIGIAIIAVMNGVAASIVDRLRDLGTLRAIGLTPSGLRRLVIVEGGTLGVLGAMLGLSVGAVAVYRFLTASIRTVAGFHIDVLWPLGAVALMLVFGGLSGMFAANLVVRRTPVTFSAER